MARFALDVFKAGRGRPATALASLCVVLGMAAPSFAASPDSVWNTPWVQVDGSASPDLINALNTGLRSANETFFYGSVATKMIATVRDDGKVDVRIIEQGSGKVLAERRGLPYEGTGRDATRSIAASALGWMDGLSCGANCAVAQSPTAKPIQVAAAPKPAEVAAPKPQEVQAAPKPAVSEPVRIAAATPAKPRVERKPARVEQPRAVVKKPAAPKKPTVRVEQPSQPARAVSRLKPTVAAAAPKKPAVKAEPAPRVAAAPAVEPTVAAAPATTKPAGSLIATTLPSTGSGDKQPAVSAPAVAEPVKPEVKTPDRPSGGANADSVLARATATQEQRVQEVIPGVVLPEPRPESLVTPVGAAVGIAPSANTTPDDKPTETVVALTQPTETAPVRSPDLGETRSIKPAAPADSEPAAPAKPADRTPTADNAAATAAAPATPLVAAIAPTVAAPQPSDDEVREELQAALRAPEPSSPTRSTEPAETPAELLKPPAETTPEPAAAPDPKPETEADPVTSVETRVAAIDPEESGPTLANARWVGFTPAVFTGAEDRAGAWIAGPFDRRERTGWITDTATGATTKVTFIWREGARGSRAAALSRKAAKALGLRQGDVANVAVYLPR